MAISLDDNVQHASTPVVKRTKIGEVFLGAIVRTEQRDVKKTNEVTKALEVAYKPNGKPKQELVVTCVALPGSTAPAGIKDHTEVPDPGTIVRVILRGGAFGQWIEARKTHRGGGLLVGDIVKQTIEHAQAYDSAGSKRGGQLTEQAQVDALQRGVIVGFYGSLTLHEPKDHTWVAKAEEAYRELTAITLEPSTANTQAADVFGGLI